MKAQEFLEYIAKSKAQNTAKSYRNALRNFLEWCKANYSMETLDRILQERKNSLRSKNVQERRKFERLIEEWHRDQLKNDASVNTARNRYVAITQFFKFFDLDLNAAVIPSEVKKTMISEDDYPLNIEDLRAMYQVADLRGRAILLMAKDLGLRLSDFRMIKLEQLPNLDSKPPVPFNIKTHKEYVQTKGFLSAETVQVLKAYKETLKERRCSYCRGRGCEHCKGTGKRPESPYLWPSNGTHPLDDDSFGIWLKNLAEKAGVRAGNQKLTFSCFRRLLMRAAIETGVGLTAAKLMVGKAVAKSDETYIAKAKLDEAFKKLSLYLNVTGVETPFQPELAKTVMNQQREIVNLRDTVEDLTKRLDIMTKEVDRIRIRYQYQRRLIPTAKKPKQLTEEEIDKILEAKKKTFQKLKEAGLAVESIDQL